MKKYIVTLDIEEQYFVEAASKDEALEKVDGLEPDQSELVDTTVEEDA